MALQAVRESGALLLLLLLVVLASYSVSTVHGETVQITGLGTVNGSETTTARTQQRVLQFLNIPYAEAPIGPRRFRAPVAIGPWVGVKDVSIEGRPCPQLGITDLLPPLEQTRSENEDCLSLSVFTKNVTERRPVMVYIHGGSFTGGRAADYPPNYLLERDIVLVVLQYRLGALGFLSTMTDVIPGNVAMLDMLMALQWVQDHVSVFGGDPSRVTVFGQSAGSAAISALLYSPLVPPTAFRQAILQSGGSTSAWAVDPNPVDNAREVARFAGCNPAQPIEDVERCLLELPVVMLLRAVQAHTLDRMQDQGHNNVGGSGMVVGGPTNFLPASPFNLLRTGQVRKDVRLMAGVTKHDGSFMMTGIYDSLNAVGLIENRAFNQFDLIDTVNRILGIDENSGTLAGFEVDSLFSQEELASGNFTRLMNGLIDIAGAIVIKAALLRDVQAIAQHSSEPAYLYTFDYRGQHTRFGYGLPTAHYPFSGGVHHSDDNIYLFPYPADVTNLNAADTAMSETMLDLWTSFAINGVPSSSRGIPTWPRVTGPAGPYLHINNPATVGTNFYDEYVISVHTPSAANVLSIVRTP
ncbi:glutactin-like [Anopheles bellator]|uniref:glutactin-like n=1 Tax=Anopheles bellator TaxID=139047 RepID=UPI002648E913|nr:glutactin-like [Anopheles bellator]